MKSHRVIFFVVIVLISRVDAMMVPPAGAMPLGSSVAIGQQQSALERSAGRLFRSAIEKIDDKDFWHATRELIVVLDFYPNFSKTDGVLYHLGECLYEMDMYKSSVKMLSYLLTNYPQSEYVPQTLLSLQKLYYNRQELENSLSYFVGLTTRFPNNDDVLDGAHYYGGMSYFHQKNYDEAIQALGKVRSRSEFYDYSLYTVGLCFLKKKVFSSPSKFSKSLLHCRSWKRSARMSSQRLT